MLDLIATRFVLNRFPKVELRFVFSSITMSGAADSDYQVGLARNAEAEPRDWLCPLHNSERPNLKHAKHVAPLDRAMMSRSRLSQATLLDL